jgi:NADP-dependent 3-hydroxy acid dehydrogenase YdfG
MLIKEQAMTLTNKVALITGGGTGMGAAIAQALVTAGAQVVIIGRRAEPLQAVANQVAGVRWYAADITQRADIIQLMAWVHETVGTVDMLINNAGANIQQRKLSELSLEDWDALLAVNTTGAFNLIHSVLPDMRAKGDGLIINISSIAGIRPSALAGAAYNASKQALVALNASINLEEAANGIRATLLAPGEVNTPLLDKRPVPVPQETRLRILQPEDIAAAVLFVAQLPARACVTQLIISPTIYPFA